MAGKVKDLKVSIKFDNVNLQNVSFVYAASLLEGYVKAVRDSCYRLVNVINKDNRIASWVSSGGGILTPPEKSSWEYVLGKINEARRQYSSKSYKVAEYNLVIAAGFFNFYLKQWIFYKNSIIRGAEIAIITMEVTIKIAEVYVVVASAGTSLIVGAGVQAGMTGVSELSKRVGLRAWGINPEFGISDILKDVGSEMVESFASALLGGKLNQVFLRSFIPKFGAIARFDKSLAKEAYKKGILTEQSFKLTDRLRADLASSITSDAILKPLVYAIAKTAKDSRDKNMSFESFLDAVIKNYIENSYKAASKLYFIWKLKK